MDPVARALLDSWRVDPWPIAGLLAATAVYWRGWRRLAAHRGDRGDAARDLRPVAFVAAAAVLWVAVASPLDDYAGLWLRAHMLQHIMLMSVVPPLFWLAAPYRPLLVGLPTWIRKEALGPLLSWPLAQRAAAVATRPLVAALVLAAVTWTWHVPALYELALRDPFWHRVEHALFVGAAALLWYAVVQPPPARSAERVAALPALFLTVLQTGALAALLVFADRVLYPSYAAGPQIGRLTPLEDQAAAGALLWLVDGVIGVAAAMLVTVAWLAPPLVRPAAPRATAGPGAPPAAGSRGRVGAFAGRLGAALLAPLVPAAAAQRRRPGEPFDLLAVAVVGPLLARRRFRTALRAVLLVLAALIVWDGLRGPPLAYANAAGVLPWTHWRGLAVVALLVGGNFFCMACPFVLPRDLGRKLLGRGRRWPRQLRSKWLAAALLAAWLCAYEAFAPWDSPAFTAWLVVGYFAAAFAVDGWFRGASFCKYVCPIGQFHFLQSLTSPLEVRPRDVAVCASCPTHDCLRGREGQRGCELELFLPTKVGNLDCTFCLDCADACPHANVGVLAVSPAAGLLDDAPRSSLGRLAQRGDVAALALVFVFGAFASAAAMTPPGARLLAEAARLSGTSPATATSLALLAAVVLVPAAAVGGAASLGRALGARGAPLGPLFCRLALAFVPLGAAAWAAHLLLHGAAGWLGVVPLAQRFAAALGMRAVEPDWMLAHAAEIGPAFRTLQILLLDAGVLAALFAAWRAAESAGRAARGRVSALLVWLPGALVAAALWALGVWLVFQPMEMRGTMMMGAG